MHFIDYAIFVLYLLGVLAIGFYHFRRNRSTEDYYVGSRNIKAHHVGLSIVATDVGGGFSIGLGGVGFVMGLSGSWLLFTGLVGAWLTAVLVIPRIKRIDAEQKMFTYPDFLRFRYNNAVALLAAVISGIGYLGFTGGQIQAGATLASSTMIREPVLGLEPRTFALVVIAVITVLYTVIGGLKAVIYTDTIQWIILLTGLIFVTVPVTLVKIGGFAALREALPPEFFTLTNIEWYTYINWMVTIIPIWLIGMTLYQRMYACRDEKEARRAWYIAGIFEYPIMAFTGVFLGMCARVVFPEIPDSQSETAMPRLIQEVLPVGVTGIVIASYFSAIMSTADSCLMAASGNFVNDVIERAIGVRLSKRVSVRLSMGVTLVTGVIATLLAARFETVLDAILLAYSFMVAGLFVPTLGAYFWKRSSSAGAFGGMLAGGLLTLVLIVLFRLAGGEELPIHTQGLIMRLEDLGLDASLCGIVASAFTHTQGLIMRLEDLGLDASLYGIVASAVVFIALSLLFPDRPAQGDEVAHDA